MNFYIYDKNDNLLCILHEENGLISAPFREELNRFTSTFSLIVDAGSEFSKYIVQENQVVFKDIEGDYRVFVIKELEELDNPSATQITAICEAGILETSDAIIEDRRFQNRDLEYILNDLLTNYTRWELEYEAASFPDLSQSFYYENVANAILEILSGKADFKDIVVFDENGKKFKRVLKVMNRRGEDRGKIFDIDYDMTEIKRTIISYPKTALYGRGASLPTEDGGYTRLIDFADIEWKKSNGDPVDKPKGQKWVGNPDALEKYGLLKDDGTKLHRFGIYQNQQIEDPEELLKATWEQVKNISEPEVNYELSVQLFEYLAGYEHEKVRLGDTARLVDRNFTEPILIQSRIIVYDCDLLNVDETAVVEMGQFLSVIEEREENKIDKVIDAINEIRSEPNVADITDESFPDIIPPIPTNLKAVGGFSKIMLTWDYLKNSEIAYYEIFASQVQGFIPAPEHVIFRGKAGAYTHTVEVDQTWYYRIRAVNYHGRASDYSEEVSANSLRINADTQIQEHTITKNLLAQEAIIDSVHIGEAVIQDIHITGKISSSKVVVDGNTTYGEGYDPSQKADKDYVDDIASQIDAEFERLRTDLTTELSDVSGKIDELESELETTFKDGVIQEAEAKAIATYLNSLNSEKADIDNKYNTIYNDGYLVGNAKTNLYNAKVSYNNAHNSLVTSINNAISDGKVTPSEKSDVDSKFTNYRNALSTLSQRFEEAIRAIENAKIDAVEIGGRNLLLNSSKEFRIAEHSQWYATIGRINLAERGLKAGDTVTFSVYVKTGPNGGAMARLRWEDDSTNIANDLGTHLPENSEGRIQVTGVVRQDATSLRLVLNNVNNSEPYQSEYKEEKLEKGTKATDWSPAPEDVQEQIDNKPDTTYVDDRINSVVTDYQSMIEMNADEILAQVSETITTTEGALREYTDSKVAQTAEEFNISFTNIQQSIDEQGQSINEVRQYFNFSADGLDIGRTDSPLNINISNEQLSFKDNGNIVAYINGQKMFITDAEILKSLVVGNHKIEKYNNEITILRWVGE